MDEELIARVAEKAEADPAIRDALKLLVGEPVDDPSAASEVARDINAARVSNSFRAFQDAALRTDEVVEEVPTIGDPQEVHRLEEDGALLGVASGQDTLYPRWQFGPEGRRAELDRILGSLERFVGDDVVAADRVMRMERRELGGRTLSEALDDPGSEEEAWAILDGLGGYR